MGRKKKVIEIEEPKEVDIEVPKLRTISNLSELQMLIKTGTSIYQTKNVMDRILITEEELMNLPFGTLLKMLKEYKLHRY